MAGKHATNFGYTTLVRHTTFTTGSPSVQVNVETLNQALQHGLAFETKSNEEIVIGVRGDLLLYYVHNAFELHQLAEDAASLEIVRRASVLEEISANQVAGLSQQRQIVVRETSRWSRSTSFRRRVLTAYDNRCAVTRWQLNFIEAAHILPVAAGAKSIDDVRNGIALSPTYHRAFDNGLIYLNHEMEMILNETGVDEIRRVGLAGGVDEFRTTLGKIHLPYDSLQRPDPYFIDLANEYRGFQ